MDYKKKLIIRFICNTVYFFIGVFAILMACFYSQNRQILLSFGTVFVAFSIVKIVQNLQRMKNKELFQKSKIIEHDERNIMLLYKSRNMSFVITMIILAITTIISYIVGQQTFGMILSFIICIATLTYLISFLVLKNKY